MRPSKISVIKAVAEEFANLSTCSSRAKVGAVLFDKDFRIVATGYNGVPQGLPHCDEVGCVTDGTGSCIAAVHAEMNAILQCALYGISTRGLALYVTHSPCDRCAIVIVRAGIREVIYGSEYHRANRTTEVFRMARVQYSAVTISRRKVMP
jgi:dCMP deaminase